MVLFISIILMLFSPLALSASYNYDATIIRIIDGDTFVARINIFPRLEAIYSVRILSIQAPELSAKCPQEKQLAIQAKARLQELLPVESKVQLKHVNKLDSFGRVLAHVHRDKYGDIANWLIKENHAVPSAKGKKHHWCE